MAENLAANLMVGYDDQGDGFGRNLTTGHEANKSKSFSVRGKLLWTPGEDTKVILAGDYNYLNSSIGIGWRPPYGAIPAFGPPFTGGKEDIYSEIDPYYRSGQGGVSLRVEQDLGFAELLSISAYRREELDLLVDVDNGLPIATVVSTMHKLTDQYSQEFQLLGPSSSRFKWVVGLFGFYLDGRADPLGLSGPGIAPLSRLDYFSGQKLTSGAVFGQVTVDDILPATDLTLGGRYTIEERRVAIDQTGYFGGPDGTLLGSTRDRETWRSPTWRISLDHKFSRAVVGYVSYNRGFKSGTFNLVVIPAESVKPETLDAFEAGLKIEALDRRLRINSAAFYYNSRDLQVPRYSNGSLFLSNAGKSRIYGLELDASFEPVRTLRLGAGLSLLDAKYTAFNDTVFSTPSPTGGNIITYGSAAGKQILLTPKTTVNASLTYTLPGKLDGFEFNATYYYNSGWYADPDNRVRQPSFNQVNVQLAWTSPDDRFRITAWAHNLTDEIYAQYLSGSGATADVFSASAPRTFGVTLGTNF